MALDAEQTVRLLINDRREDVDPLQLFTTEEIEAYLELEGGSAKRAAAQALDTIADDEALTSKVITTQDVRTDGAKVADSLRKRAAALRDQADREDDESDDGAFLEIVPFTDTDCGPELTGRQVPYL